MALVVNPYLTSTFTNPNLNNDDDEDPKGHRKRRFSTGRDHYKEEVEIPDSEDERIDGEDRDMSDEEEEEEERLEFHPSLNHTTQRNATQRARPQPHSQSQQGVNSSLDEQQVAARRRTAGAEYRRGQSSTAKPAWVQRHEDRRDGKKQERQARKQAKRADPVQAAKMKADLKAQKKRRMARNKAKKQEVKRWYRENPQ